MALGGRRPQATQKDLANPGGDRAPLPRLRRGRAVAAHRMLAVEGLVERDAEAELIAPRVVDRSPEGASAPPALTAGSVGANGRARPKSVTHTRPSRLRSTFSGL